MHLHLSVDLPEDRAHLPVLRRMTRDALALLQLDQSDIDDIELVLGELASNAILHSHAGQYHVDVEVHGDQAIVTVRDGGPGFRREHVLPPGTTRPDLSEDSDDGTRIGGLGLPLVELVADRVEFENAEPHGAVVRACKAIRRAN